ncbi:hypothetical protein BC829DRAFT_397280 [Chytridium lagenaria]|nr:hypothetical protein BC829DRAFT_397280 [Chytridium lagenaria]
MEGTGGDHHPSAPSHANPDVGGRDSTSNGSSQLHPQPTTTTSSSSFFGTSPMKNALAKMRSPSPMGDGLETNVWAAAKPSQTGTTPAVAAGFQQQQSAVPHEPAATAATTPSTEPHPKHHLTSDVIRRVTIKAHHDEDSLHPHSSTTTSPNHDRNNTLHRDNSHNSFASIAQAAIQADRIRAPNRSEGQLQGAERSSAHGRFYRLHDYAVFTKFVQIGGCLWLLVGMVMACTIFMAITINVSYAAFNASRGTSIWPLIIGLVFYIELGYVMVSSFIRTGVRMQIYIWGANFGNDPDSDIFPIFLIAPFLTKMMASLTGIKAQKDTEADSETDPLLGNSSRDLPPAAPITANGLSGPADPDNDEEKEASIEEIVAWRVDLIGHIFYLILLFFILAIPMGYYTFKRGYWALVNFISIGICISSLLFIIFVNICARTYRTWRVVEELWNHPEEVSDSQLRANYYASTGFDTGKDLLGFIVKRGLSSAIVIFVAALAFSHFNPDLGVIIVSGLFIAAFLIARLPYIRQLAYSFQKRTFWQPYPDYRKSEGYALYNGAEDWPAFVAFGLRCAVFVIGFSCLLYYDLFWRRKGDSSEGSRPPLEVGVHRIVLFLMIVIVRYSDPTKPYWYIFGNARARVGIMAGLMLSGLFLSIYSYAIFPCFSSSVSLVVAFLILSYRHPRCRWTNYQRTFKTEKFSRDARLERRATRNARNTLIVIVLVIATSWITALIIGLATDAIDPINKTALPKTFLPRIPALGLPSSFVPKNTTTLSTLRNTAGFRPAVCSVAITTFNNNLDILDVAAMARGSYEPCSKRAEDIIHGRDRLKGWVAFNTTLPTDCAAPDNGDGVQWIEFRDAADTNGISIVAVRGTSNFNDVFQDLYLWSTSALLQLSSFLGTLVTVWPADTVDLLADSIMKFGPLDSTLVYWNAVEAKVQELIDANRTVIMTGHSLGGAVANSEFCVLSAWAGLFDKEMYVSAMFSNNLKAKNLHKYTMNVVPARDAVPCFDLQMGLVQSIPCEQDEFLSCHSLDLTIETLKAEC